jgi:hypothetical protein
MQFKQVTGVPVFDQSQMIAALASCHLIRVKVRAIGSH